MKKYPPVYLHAKKARPKSKTRTLIISVSSTSAFRFVSIAIYLRLLHAQKAKKIANRNKWAIFKPNPIHIQDGHIVRCVLFSRCDFFDV